MESYQLGRQIGSGGFGAVLNAVCKTTGRQVAIKKVHKNNVPKSYTVRSYCSTYVATALELFEEDFLFLGLSRV